jgi:predicted nucleic acid-binding protein
MCVFMRPMSPTPTPASICPPLLNKSGKPDADVPSTLKYLRHLVEPVDREYFAAFEEEARQRLRGRDEEDWPVLATALALVYSIWTEDADFFGTGIAVWTTNRVEIFLKAQAKPPEPRDL